MRTRDLAMPMLALGLLVAACGGGGADTATTAPTAAPATAAPESMAPESMAPAGGPAVNLGDTSLGTVLVDGAGKTLYIFTADSGGTSVCNGECAAAWPPLLGDSAPTLGAGLDAADFTTITRDDGSSQVAFFGMPLYYFAADAAAGDVKGQGLNDKWFVVDAEGTPVK